jgi:hypothetical protein
MHEIDNVVSKPGMTGDNIREVTATQLDAVTGAYVTNGITGTVSWATFPNSIVSPRDPASGLPTGR